jgi:hypothetical protein
VIPVYAERFDFSLTEHIRLTEFKIDKELERLVTNRAKEWSLYISADSIAREEETVIEEGHDGMTAEEHEIACLLRLGKHEHIHEKVKVMPIIPVAELKCVTYF